MSITENGCHKAFALVAVREVLRTNRTFPSHHVTRAAPATSSQGPRVQEKIVVQRLELSHSGAGVLGWLSLTPPCTTE